jgi:hypothetical protein
VSCVRVLCACFVCALLYFVCECERGVKSGQGVGCIIGRDLVLPTSLFEHVLLHRTLSNPNVPCLVFPSGRLSRIWSNITMVYICMVMAMCVLHVSLSGHPRLLELLEHYNGHVQRVVEAIM